MNIVVLDIETITPDWRPPVDAPGKFPPVPWHRPVVAVILRVQTDPISFELMVCRENQCESVAQTCQMILEDAHRIVTFNGRGFDMPVLQIAAMREGLDWSWWNKAEHRFVAYNKPLVHHDVMDQLSNYGAASGGISLDACCRAVGLPGKIDVDGKSVADLYQQRKISEICQYCAEDVLQTWLLYLKLSKARGWHKNIEDLWQATHSWAVGNIKVPQVKRIAQLIDW